MRTISKFMVIVGLCAIYIFMLGLLGYNFYRNKRGQQYGRSIGFRNYEKIPMTSDENHTVILVWARESFRLPEAYTINCKLNNCRFTTLHNYYYRYDMYDAILFVIPDIKTAKINNLPRRSEQIYVMASKEPPTFYFRNLRRDDYLYNATFTYRFDSDILWNYGVFKNRSTNEIIAPAVDPQWVKCDVEWTQRNKTLLRAISKKRRLVAWFVSKCDTPSGRERIAFELKKYINIDYFGKCGNLRCYTNCDQLLENYKFYLSFENSVCHDYVTEKFYRAYQNGAVPIVFGALNYTRFGPPHSYIDLQDFSTIYELVKFLKYLDENPFEYAKYFWWQKYYTVADLSDTDNLCDLCNYIASNRNKSKCYPSIHNYWYSNKDGLNNFLGFD